MRDDYVDAIEAHMAKNYYNRSSLAKRTGYSAMHIGNVLKGLGSDDAIVAICKVMQLPLASIMKDEYKELFTDDEAQVTG